MFREEAAKLVLNYRIENNLTQLELSKILKISNGTLCDIENEKETVRRITIEKVSKKIKELSN